jgi:hypothetical protein
MTDINLSFTPEALFQQVLARGREQGVVEQAAFNDLLEDVIETHRAVGEIDTSDSTEDMEEQLRGRWVDYKASLEEKPAE